MFVNFNMKKFYLILLVLSTLFGKDIIAVLDLEQIGLTPQEAKILTQRLTTKLISINKYQVVERTNMDKILKEQKFQNSGCTDSECAVEIGQLLNTDFIVIGSVSKFGSTYALDSRLIDVAQGKSLISAEFSAKGEIDILLNEGLSSIAKQLSEFNIEIVSSVKENVVPAEYKPVSKLDNINFPIIQPVLHFQDTLPNEYKYNFSIQTHSIKSYYSNLRQRTTVCQIIYFPRKYSKDKPLGILPFNHKNHWINMELTQDSFSELSSLTGRYFTSFGYDLKYRIELISSKTKSHGFGIGKFIGNFSFFIESNLDSKDSGSLGIANYYFNNYHLISMIYIAQNSSSKTSFANRMLLGNWLYDNAIGIRTYKHGYGYQNTSTIYFTFNTSYFIRRNLSVSLGVTRSSGIGGEFYSEGSSDTFYLDCTRHYKNLIITGSLVYGYYNSPLYSKDVSATIAYTF